MIYVLNNPQNFNRDSDTFDNLVIATDYELIYINGTFEDASNAATEFLSNPPLFAKDGWHVPAEGEEFGVIDGELSNDMETVAKHLGWIGDCYEEDFLCASGNYFA